MLLRCQIVDAAPSFLKQKVIERDAEQISGIEAPEATNALADDVGRQFLFFKRKDYKLLAELLAKFTV